MAWKQDKDFCHLIAQAGFSLFRLGFMARSVYVGFVVDKMALRQVFL
jgi:hypothetical protein